MTDRDAIFTAFCAAGLWPGLSATLAAALPDAGIHSPGDVTAQNLALLPKVGPTRAGRLLSAFIAAAPAYDVAELLAPAEIDLRVANRVVDLLGPGAGRLLRDDPWQLLGVAGIAPADADRVARAAIPGVQRDDPRRGRALVGFVLTRHARMGHTVTPRPTVVREVSAYGIGDAEAAADAALANGDAVEVGEDSAGLSAARYAAAEDSVANGIARLIATAKPIAPDSPGPAQDLDDAQQHAVRAALTYGVSVLTGGPGTGKSRTVATLVTLVEQAGLSVALAAPTGRAAKRLEELCGTSASTLHRLLGAQPRQSGGGDVRFDGGFSRGEDWPLDEDVIVVDEASMLDVELADALLSACSDGTHLVFVGDAAQLPSIGPGRVLGDIIDSGTVPVTELTTLYRQAEGGTIARLATAVRAGTLPPIDDPTREVAIVPAANSAETAHRVVQLVTDSIPRALGIASDQVQVVTPVHRGPAGTQALNAALKAVLNPGPGRFDVGDRVVATANHLEAEPFGYANGEVGTVAEVERGGAVTVEFASGPAEIKGKALADLVHGWAITVHRAQGSEFPAVVVVLPSEAGGMLSRPLVYTALTRAQRHLSVVHSAGPAVARGVREVGTLPRRTQLQALLVDNVTG